MIIVSDSWNCFACICRTVGDDLKFLGRLMKVLVLLIMGWIENDYVLKFSGMEDLTKGEKANELVPNLEVIFIPEETLCSRTISPAGEPPYPCLPCQTHRKFGNE